MVESEGDKNSNLNSERKALRENSARLKGGDIANGVVYALSTPEHVQVC